MFRFLCKALIIAVRPGSKLKSLILGRIVSGIADNTKKKSFFKTVFIELIKIYNKVVQDYWFIYMPAASINTCSKH